MKDMAGAAANTTSQIKQITRANRDHSQSAVTVSTELASCAASPIGTPPG